MGVALSAEGLEEGGPEEGWERGWEEAVCSVLSPHEGGWWRPRQIPAVVRVVKGHTLNVTAEGPADRRKHASLCSGAHPSAWSSRRYLPGRCVNCFRPRFLS